MGFIGNTLKNNFVVIVLLLNLLEGHLGQILQWRSLFPNLRIQYFFLGLSKLRLSFLFETINLPNLSIVKKKLLNLNH